jgi:hypothetical protein
MTNQYRALTPHAAAMFEDWLNRGFLELVPRPYRVLTNNYTIEGWPVPQEAIVTASFPIEVEAALIAGGHLERCRRDAHPTVELDADSEESTKKATRKGVTPNQNDKE